MAKLTVEYPNGETDEFVHAYGITQYQKIRSQRRDLKSQIEDIRELEIRDDDIYLATFPKCGTHWVWEILVMLKKGNAEYETKTKGSSFLDFQSPEVVKNLQSPRVLNCHFSCKLVPKQMLQKGTKIVHVMRNPKDAFVSYYHHMNTIMGGVFSKTFQDFLPLMLGDYGVYMFYPWFKYVKEWERLSKQHPGQILNIFFEDLKKRKKHCIHSLNALCEKSKMLSAFGSGRSEDLVRQIAESCDFSNLKKADAEIKVHDNFKKENLPVMYRKGEVGDWKNYFTVAQNERMDKWLEENLTDTDLKFKYTL